MLGSAIAAAESRVVRSRADLATRIPRLGIVLPRPAGLRGAAGGGALVGFAAARLRANALTRALAAGLSHGLSRYVRYRTAQREVPGPGCRPWLNPRLKCAPFPAPSRTAAAKRRSPKGSAFPSKCCRTGS